jgi:hypothetical protein
MNLSAEWAAVAIATGSLAVVVVGSLLSCILGVLKGIREDIKEVMLRQATTETRLCVAEEVLRRLKCQRCENG